MPIFTFPPGQNIGENTEISSLPSQSSRKQVGAYSPTKPKNY